MVAIMVKVMAAITNVRVALTDLLTDDDPAAVDLVTEGLGQIEQRP